MQQVNLETYVENDDSIESLARKCHSLKGTVTLPKSANNTFYKRYSIRSQMYLFWHSSLSDCPLIWDVTTYSKVQLFEKTIGEEFTEEDFPEGQKWKTLLSSSLRGELNDFKLVSPFSRPCDFFAFPSWFFDTRKRWEFFFFRGRVAFYSRESVLAPLQSVS